MDSVAVAVMIGPAEREVERTADLLDAVRHFEHGRLHFVVVDDAPQQRDLEEALPDGDGVTVTSLHHPRHGPVQAYRKGKGICSAVLTALKHIQAHTDATLVLKLDTDSLVIAPFVGKLRAAFAARPNVASLGAYDRTPAGAKREFLHGVTVRAIQKPKFEPRALLKSLQSFSNPGLRIIRSHIATAARNGYIYGEHCLGGGYALHRDLLDRMAAAGYLSDPMLWASVDLPEDVMMGIYVRAVGMGFANFVGKDEVFGVRHIGLPDLPEQIVSKGYSVIHSVKNDPNVSEEEVREFFRHQRAAIHAR